LHLIWTRLLVASVSASSDCLVHAILGMSSINILPCLTFAYCSTRGISAPPLTMSSISRPGMSTRHQFRGVSRDVLVFKARIFVRPFPAGRFSINRFSLALFLHCQQGVSPSIFGHQYLITMDNNVLVCGNVFLEVSLRLASNEIRYPVSHTLLRIKSCIPTRCYQRNAACTRYSSISDSCVLFRFTLGVCASSHVLCYLFCRIRIFPE